MRNFKESYQKFIRRYNLFNPNKYQKSNERNQYVDYIELVGIFAKNEGVTLGDIYELIFDNQDFDSEIDELKAEEKEVDTESYRDSDSETARLTDHNWSFVHEIFDLIIDRQSLFGLNYPFIVDQEKIIVKSNLNSSHKIYIYLLLCSMLDIFGSFISDLTKEFELASSVALKKYIPTLIVKQFGKNSEYTGNTENKIRNLINDLGLKPHQINVNEIPKNASEEKGLDIAAWIPFEDNGFNKLIFLAQCTCGKDFKSKFIETKNWVNFIDNSSHTKFVHLMFLPFTSLNTRTGLFFDSINYNYNHVTFDRKRILSLLPADYDINQLKSMKLVDACIEYEQPII